MSGSVFTSIGSQTWLGRRYLISAATRTAWDPNKRELTLTTYNLDEITAPFARKRTLLEDLERLLLLLADRTEEYGSAYDFDPNLDYPLLAVNGISVIPVYLSALRQFGWVHRDHTMLTVKGWLRADELRVSVPNSRQAFVAMSFDPALNDAWTQGIRPGVEASKYYQPLRVDGREHNGKIDDFIVAEIKRSGLLVADLTGLRGGVYFEAGYAMGLGIPVIWTCRDNDDFPKIHFDTRQYNFIKWSTPDDLRDRLTDRIRATVMPRPV